MTEIFKTDGGCTALYNYRREPNSLPLLEHAKYNTRKLVGEVTKVSTKVPVGRPFQPGTPFGQASREFLACHPESYAAGRFPACGADEGGVAFAIVPGVGYD